MNHIGTQRIKTNRLTLRKITLADTSDFFVLCSKPSVSRYVTWYTHENIETTKVVVQSWVNSYNDDRYLWAIEYNSRVIGNIDVISLDDGVAHMGWMIDEPYWNQGIMTEATVAVRDYLFEKVGIRKMESMHIIENIGSGRVMQKIGMTFRENRIFDNADKPKFLGKELAYYALTREEWETI